MRKVVVAAMFAWCVPGLAYADSITAFSIFGGNSASLKNQSSVLSGLAGSNGNFSIEVGPATTLTATGGGTYSSKSNQTTNGNIVFDGNVSLDNGHVVNGDIHSGGTVFTGDNSTINGNIVAGGQVIIGNGSSVNGNVDAGINAGVAVSLGNTVSAVTGTVTHKSGTTITDPGAVSVGGNVIGTPATPTDYTTTVLPTATVFAAGTTDIITGNFATTTLLPQSALAAQYDDIFLGPNNIVNLTAGTYRFDTFIADNNLTMNFDVTAGGINLLFAGNVNIGSNLIFNIVGGNASDIYAETKGNFVTDINAQLKMTIFGSGASSIISTKAGANVTGALWAVNQVNIDNASTINFLLHDKFAPTAVPEPSSLALVGAAFFALAGYLRKSRQS
jgi:hypothetical protein